MGGQLASVPSVTGPDQTLPCPNEVVSHRLESPEVGTVPVLVLDPRRTVLRWESRLPPKQRTMDCEVCGGILEPVESGGSGTIGKKADSTKVANYHWILPKQERCCW